jgi:hypothetical protein
MLMQNGLQNTDAGGYFSTLYTNPATVQEIVYDTAAGSIESHGGGVRINIIPRDGGNRFSGTLFAQVTPLACSRTTLTQISGLAVRVRLIESNGTGR